MHKIYLLIFGIVFISSSFGDDLNAKVEYEDADNDNVTLVNRILNGQIAKPMTFPYMVSLQEKYEDGALFKFCGGVIIKPKWILTAAHCVIDENVDDFRVRAGIVKFNDTGPTSQFVPLRKIILHPNYNPTNFFNDIAILKLKYPLKFNKYVKPIALPPKGYIATGNGTIVGWGDIDNEEVVRSSVLRYATLPVSKREDCEEYFDPPVLEKHQLCLGIGSTSNACSGDSGGPFVQIIRGKPAVIGVTSYGKSGCYEHHPIVYTNVASHLDFIRETIKEKFEEISNGSNEISHPYLVSLLDYNELEESYEKFCTGVIVHEKWILTAADCFDNENVNRTEYIRIKIGSPRIHKNESDGLLEISKFVRHPMYKIDDNDVKFNIALIKLKDSLSNSQSKDKAFLPPNYFDVNSFNGQIIGWHIENSTDDSADDTEYTLAAVNVTNGDSKECTKYFPNQTESTICIVRSGESCNFDTSGPLIIPNSNGNFILGLNAIVGKNCEENKPFLVSNILYFSEFIDKIINSN